MQLDPIERVHLTLSAGAVAAGYAFASPAFATSLVLGAAIEAVNFRGLLSASRRVFGGDVALGNVWVAVFALRFVMLAAAIGFALRAGAHPVGLVLGLSMIVPAVVVGAWRQRPPVVPHGDVPVAAPDDPTWDAWNPWLARERELAPSEDRD